MITEKKKQEYYQALLKKNKAYEGIFFVGVKTTGVFCRPTCPARKPKIENCEFFEMAQDALLASFRPCKRCKPLSHPNVVSKLVQTLVEAVEKDPEKHWKESDFKQLSVNASTARRQFKKRFGMTFVAYARARRMGLAMKQIKEGKPVIEAQLSSGYESGSGFRDAFSRIMGAAPSRSEGHHVLKAFWIDTPLGPMLSVADNEALYLLEFVDRRGLEKEIEQLRRKTKLPIIPGKTKPIEQVEAELVGYFSGKLREFTTPLFLIGSQFQKRVWQELQKVPLGETRSYAEIAAFIGKPSAFRAVASANGANQFAIVIPCHRIINSNGALGGYGGGIKRKEWLLKHEKQYTEMNSKVGFLQEGCANFFPEASDHCAYTRRKRKGKIGCKADAAKNQLLSSFRYKTRCFGSLPGKEFYAEYHDKEWGIPVHDDRRLFEMLSLEGAQAGLSWETILKRREGYREAFYHFDPSKVAKMTNDELNALLKNEGIIRNRLKIYATRQNAQVFLQIQKEFGSFDRYVWNFVHGKPIVKRRKYLKDIPASTPVSDALSKDLKKRGMTFVGSTIIYAFMQAVGLVDDHLVDCWCSNR